MISIATPGSFNKTLTSLRKMSKNNIMAILNSYGEEGVSALSSATPLKSGLAATSWGFEVSENKGVYTLVWTNADVESGFPVAIMIQYGYATGTGGYVQGEDYINPAIKPIFDAITDKVWKAVTSA